MMHFLFLFLDGVGLGPNNPDTNPFARAEMPNLNGLLEGNRLVQETISAHPAGLNAHNSTLLALGTTLGVAGPPQSASGQSTILTGKNVPKIIGKHYGPKPNPEIRAILQEGNLFHHLAQSGKRAALLNAYPQGYFDNIDSGRRLPGAIAMAALDAGLPLMTTADLVAGQAISADLTGEGWRSRLKIPGIPVLSPDQAGKQMAASAREYDFSLFEYWLSDYAGHRSEMEDACQLLETFDGMLGGLLANWDFESDLIFLTSDHGNLENIRTRKHTTNPVPGLILGPKKLRDKFSKDLSDLTGIAPAILSLFE